jgi:hypothetical protein
MQPIGKPEKPTKQQTEEKPPSQVAINNKFNIINHSSSITAGNVTKGLVHPQNSALQKTDELNPNSNEKPKSVDLAESTTGVVIN